MFFLLVLTGIVTTGACLITFMVIMATGERRHSFAEKVGIVEVYGVISDATMVIQDLKAMREDDSVKAVVLRIDSPGGGVGASQEIYREVLRTKKEKRVVASMGGVAASGGYYVAAGADQIMASRGTLTGSIGVIMGYTNFSELMEKIGLSPVVIKSGRFKDAGSPAREMTPEERALLEEFVESVHDQFISDVAESRNLDEALLRQVADGRIMTGEFAREKGLVDTFGNLEDAIQLAGKLGGIKGKVVSVYAREEPFSLIQYLTGASAGRIVRKSLQTFLYPGYFYQPPGLE